MATPYVLNTSAEVCRTDDRGPLDGRPAPEAREPSPLTRRVFPPGLHVIATARRPEVLADLAAQGMSVVALDVTDAASIAACQQQVAAITDGKLDILVNNAYVCPLLPFP